MSSTFSEFADILAQQKRLGMLCIHFHRYVTLLISYELCTNYLYHLISSFQTLQ